MLSQHLSTPGQEIDIIGGAGGWFWHEKREECGQVWFVPSE